MWLHGKRVVGVSLSFAFSDQEKRKQGTDTKGKERLVQQSQVQGGEDMQGVIDTASAFAESTNETRKRENPAVKSCIAAIAEELESVIFEISLTAPWLDGIATWVNVVWTNHILHNPYSA